MKIFLSWAGESSREVAEALRVWLPDVIAFFEPWVSSEDIEKGARWTADLAQELEDTQVGIICLTPDNLSAPWILYEAGALAKIVDKGRVCTYLHGVAPTDVGGPLVQFQATLTTRDDTYRLLQTLNRSLGDEQVSDARLSRLFDLWWPELERKLLGIPPTMAVSQRSERELLEELVGLARQARRTDPGGNRRVRGPVVDFNGLLADLESGRLLLEPGPGVDDPNAENWASSLPSGSEGIGSEWASRWFSRDHASSDESETVTWNVGTAALVRNNGTTLIHMADATGEYLILARTISDGSLLGSYFNLQEALDTGAWRGMVRSPKRIDGVWSGGRWDLRRAE